MMKIPFQSSGKKSTTEGKKKKRDQTYVLEQEKQTKFKNVQISTRKSAKL